MALPDYFKTEPNANSGTAVYWGDTGASSATLRLGFNGLADAAGRMGEVFDLGAQFHQRYSVGLAIETGTAPVAGTVVEGYLAFSHDGVSWPGLVTGSDAAYPLIVATNKKQLGNPAIMFIAVNTGNFTQRQAPTVIRPWARYVAPVVVNLLGQSVRSTTAASNNSRLTMIPLAALVQDTA